MAGYVPRPSALEKAKPTVRLKGKENEYGETLEFVDFQFRGGKQEELMDEERWLGYPDSPDVVERNDRHGNQRDNPRNETRILEGQTIWNPTFLDKVHEVRSTTEPHLTFYMLPRARTKKSMVRDTVDVLGKELTSTLTTQSKIKYVYIGVSALDSQPVFMFKSRTGSNQVTSIRTGILDSLRLDNTANVQFIARSGLTPHPHEIIWTENMLIPGNISYVKQALHQRLSDAKKKQFLQIMKREHDLVLEGFGAAGVAKVLPSTEVEERKPAICRAIHDGKTYSEMHFVLRWPPMALLQFPPDMIVAMRRFLDFYPQDNIPLNVALAATIIYFDMDRDGGLEKEGFLDSVHHTSLRKPPLGMFIVYFPHMLRFVETNHLTAFINPCRFSASHYARDNAEDREMKVNSNPPLIGTIAMRSWCSQIRSRYPQVSSDLRLTLIPASMPGTTMVFPQNYSYAEKPSSDLFILCCLNDVRTLGLPSYHYVRRVEKVRPVVGGPNWVFSNALQSPVSTLNGSLYASYWKAKPSKTIKALTGKARKIGPVFPDVGSEYYEGQAITACVERRFDTVSSYTQNFQLCNDMNEHFRNDIATRAEELNRIADHLSIPSSERRISRQTLCPEWDGMEGHLGTLLKEGNLKRVATQQHPLPPAKRSKPLEPTLSPEVKESVSLIINGLAAMSCDWDSLREVLKTPEPKVKAVKESFSPVQSFISDMKRALQLENADNGQGDLDLVICVAFRAEGVFDASQVKTLDYKSRWEQHHHRFIKFGQGTGDAMETIFTLRNNPGGFRLILPQIQVLEQSPLLKDQIKACSDIQALLDSFEV